MEKQMAKRSKRDSNGARKRRGKKVTETTEVVNISGEVAVEVETPEVAPETDVVEVETTEVTPETETAEEKDILIETKKDETKAVIKSAENEAARMFNWRRLGRR